MASVISSPFDCLVATWDKRRTHCINVYTNRSSSRWAPGRVRPRFLYRFPMHARHVCIYIYVYRTARILVLYVTLLLFLILLLLLYILLLFARFLFTLTVVFAVELKAKHWAILFALVWEMHPPTFAIIPTDCRTTFYVVSARGHAIIPTSLSSYLYPYPGIYTTSSISYYRHIVREDINITYFEDE